MQYRNEKLEWAETPFGLALRGISGKRAALAEITLVREVEASELDEEIYLTEIYGDTEFTAVDPVCVFTTKSVSGAQKKVSEWLKANNPKVS